MRSLPSLTNQKIAPSENKKTSSLSSLIPLPALPQSLIECLTSFQGQQVDTTQTSLSIAAPTPREGSRSLRVERPFEGTHMREQQHYRHPLHPQSTFRKPTFCRDIWRAQIASPANWTSCLVFWVGDERSLSSPSSLRHGIGIRL